MASTKVSVVNESSPAVLSLIQGTGPTQVSDQSVSHVLEKPNLK